MTLFTRRDDSIANGSLDSDPRRRSLRRDPTEHADVFDSVVEHQAEVAQRRLRDSGYMALTRLECRFHDNVLVIYGNVPTYYLKQLAQTIVRNIPGTKAILNNVQVD